MTDKEKYCVGRAEFLSEFMGHSFASGYKLAEQEWEEQELGCKCEICGREFDEDELAHGVCDDCIYACGFEECLEVNGDSTESLQINSLVVSLLDESEINAILINHLREANKISPLDCRCYIDCDKNWFADRLKGVRK